MHGSIRMWRLTAEDLPLPPVRLRLHPSFPLSLLHLAAPEVPGASLNEEIVCNDCLSSLDDLNVLCALPLLHGTRLDGLLIHELGLLSSIMTASRSRTPLVPSSPNCLAIGVLHESCTSSVEID